MLEIISFIFLAFRWLFILIGLLLIAYVVRKHQNQRLDNSWHRSHVVGIVISALLILVAFYCVLIVDAGFGLPFFY